MVAPRPVAPAEAWSLASTGGFAASGGLRLCLTVAVFHHLAPRLSLGAVSALARAERQSLSASVAAKPLRRTPGQSENWGTALARNVVSKEPINKTGSFQLPE